MPKPPKATFIDSFKYKAYEGQHPLYSDPIFADPITITNARIDRGASYSSSTTGKVLLYNAVIFCVEGITTPLPVFKPQSVLTFDDQEHVITKVIPIYEPYKKAIYSYEIEVV